MTNDELKYISASNIINLRHSKGITQAELGEVLNYSDKTISKWERGDTIPDAYVLTQIAEYFEVDVNFLLSSHDDWKMPVEELCVPKKYPNVNVNALIIVVLLSIMTATVAAFVTLWLIGFFEWRILLVGLTVMAIVNLILDAVFRQSKFIVINLILLICSIFVLLFFVFSSIKPWQIFIILGPALLLAYTATRINTNSLRIVEKRKKQ